MLQSMRENMKGTIAIIVVGFLGLIMALGLVDMNSFSSNYSNSDIANVDGRVITEQELQLAIAQERQRLQAQFGENLPVEFFTDERLRQPVLQGLVKNKVLLGAALDGDMTVSDRDLDRLITELPEFQNEGQFDAQLFVQRVRTIGHTPVTFRTLLRDDVLVNQLRNAVSSTSFVTDEELARIVALSRQTRDFSWVSLPLGDRVESVTVSEEDIQAYYDENKNSYKTEEKIAVEFIDMKVGDFAADVIVGEDEIQQQYQQEVDQFKQAVLREAAHIMIEGDDDAAKAKVAEVQAKLAEGGDFAELAKTYSDDFGSRENGGNLGTSDGTAFPAEFETALAGLSENTVSEPTVIGSATHFIKLLSVEGAEPPSFEESQARIEAELKNLQAEQIYVEKLTALKDLSFNAESLKSVAEELSLPHAETALFTRSGGEGVLNENQVISAAFSEQVIQQGYASDVLELDADRAVVIKRTQYEPVRTLSLEEKREDVVAELKLQKAKEELAAQAESITAALAEGTALADLAESNSLELKTESGVTRETADLSAALVSHVFGLARPEAGPVSSSLYLDNNDYAIVSLSAVEDANISELSEEEKQGARQSLSRVSSTTQYQAFEKVLEDASDIELN